MPWPLFDLAVRGPRMSLVAVTDDVAVRLATLAAAGVHRPGEHPFNADWASAPSPERERSTLQYVWRLRAEWRPERWTQQFAAVVGDEVAGVIDLTADDFPVLRTVRTASWLGLAHQGRGLGTEMRRMVLHLAFRGLGARRALTDAWDDNDASLGVSRRLGYVESHRARAVRGGRATGVVHLALTDEAFSADPANRAGYAIEGLGPCLAMFGAA